MNSYHGKDLRTTVGYHNKEDWCKQNAIFTDETLIIAGHIVMDSWQAGYMRVLAEIVTRNNGSILEIGFGLGLASRFVQKNGHVKNHVIIECHPDVTRKCREIYKKEIECGKIKLYEDFWENVTFQFPSDSFDGILFDPYPLSEKEIKKNISSFLTKRTGCLGKMAF